MSTFADESAPADKQIQNIIAELNTKLKKFNDIQEMAASIDRDIALCQHYYQIESTFNSLVNAYHQAQHPILVKFFPLRYFGKFYKLKEKLIEFTYTLLTTKDQLAGTALRHLKNSPLALLQAATFHTFVLTNGEQKTKQDYSLEEQRKIIDGIAPPGKDILKHARLVFWDKLIYFVPKGENISKKPKWPELFFAKHNFKRHVIENFNKSLMELNHEVTAVIENGELDKVASLEERLTFKIEEIKATKIKGIASLFHKKPSKFLIKYTQLLDGRRRALASFKQTHFPQVLHSALEALTVNYPLTLEQIFANDSNLAKQYEAALEYYANDDNAQAIQELVAFMLKEKLSFLNPNNFADEHLFATQLLNDMEYLQANDRVQSVEYQALYKLATIYNHFKPFAALKIAIQAELNRRQILNRQATILNIDTTASTKDFIQQLNQDINYCSSIDPDKCAALEHLAQIYNGKIRPGITNENQSDDLTTDNLTDNPVNVVNNLGNFLDKQLNIIFANCQRYKDDFLAPYLQQLARKHKISTLSTYYKAVEHCHQITANEIETYENDDLQQILARKDRPGESLMAALEYIFSLLPPERVIPAAQLTRYNKLLTTVLIARKSSKFYTIDHDCLKALILQLPCSDPNHDLREQIYQKVYPQLSLYTNEHEESQSDTYADLDVLTIDPVLAMTEQEKIQDLTSLGSALEQMLSGHGTEAPQAIAEAKQQKKQITKSASLSLLSIFKGKKAKTSEFKQPASEQTILERSEESVKEEKPTIGYSRTAAAEA